MATAQVGQRPFIEVARGTAPAPPPASKIPSKEVLMWRLRVLLQPRVQEDPSRSIQGRALCCCLLLPTDGTANSKTTFSKLLASTGAQYICT